MPVHSYNHGFIVMLYWTILNMIKYDTLFILSSKIPLTRCNSFALLNAEMEAKDINDVIVSSLKAGASEAVDTWQHCLVYIVICQ